MAHRKIGIVDADLLHRPRHRFPNLACMKISGFHKSRGDDTELVLDYERIGEYDQIYLSKVFTDSDVPEEVFHTEKLVYGGTGFDYDRAVLLPDYDLYRELIHRCRGQGKSMKPYRFYTDYSIGFLTRGCFRQCPFCVNRNSKRSIPASPLAEFMDRGRKKLCFLDDNFLACAEWERLLDEVLETGKSFQFRQGLDLRIMKKRQMEKLFSGKTDGNILFAFDDLADREVIERQLIRIYETVEIKKNKLKFYVLCGFDREGRWEPDFWVKDIRDTLERIKILMRYECLAYVMRYEKCRQSPYKGMYIVISRWCNQPAQYLRKSLREFCRSRGEGSAEFRYLDEFEKEHSELADYFDMKYVEVSHGGIYGRGT